jgi:uncharacterized protein (TIGR00266 family)
MGMAFCSNCGNQVAEDARFCGGCGVPIGGAPISAAAAASGATMGSVPPPPPQTYPGTAHAPLEYTIEGDNLQIARVKLKAGQEVYAEAGKMVYKSANVAWDTRMSGQSVGEKLLGALRRTILGESLFLTYFRASGDGEVGFAGGYPGKIHAVELRPGQTIFAQRDAFLFAQPSVQLSIALVRRLGAGFFGGEGFILEKLIGPGMVFIHAGGDFIEFDLKPYETIQVATGCIVAFDESVHYDIQFVGGIKTAIFGGEGVFLATLTGPGRVLVQSMTLERMRRELAPGHHKDHDAHSPLLGWSGMFGSGDE